MLVSRGDQELPTLGELKFTGLLNVKGMEKTQVIMHQVVNFDLVVKAYC